MLVNGYNFTNRVRTVLQSAREEAVRLHHGQVGTEHILLGILQHPDCTAAGILTSLGVASNTLRTDVEALCNPGSTKANPGPDLPYTSRAKKVLEEAMTEARELNHSYVGTEHLLLGLFRERTGIACQALISTGLSPATVRAKALAVLGADAVEPSAWQQSAPRGILVSSQPYSTARLAVLLSLIALAIAIVALALSLR
jgi:ATP-dependent Clp protease ATP-binding subunit ClpC